VGSATSHIVQVDWTTSLTKISIGECLGICTCGDGTVKELWYYYCHV